MAVSLDKFLDQESEREETKKDEEVGFFESALAGVATGLWNIPKTAFSLGATVMDLVGDTNTARDVEAWFDEVNPWDDEAEARTIGKITSALAQVAIPAGVGFKLGSAAARTWQAKNAADLAQKALAAKKAGKYFSLAKAGELISRTPGRASLTGGLLGAGAAEAVVADENIGTFGDMAEGTSLEPLAITMMDRNESLEGRADAFRRLKNRLKFGTEGALFNLALVGAGKGIQRLRGRGAHKGVDEGLDEWAKGTIEQDFQKVGSRYGLRPEGTGTKAIHEMKGYHQGTEKAIRRAASVTVQEVDTAIKDLGKNISDAQGYRNTPAGQELFKKNLMDRVLAPNPKDKFGRNIDAGTLLKPEAKTRILKELELVRRYNNLRHKIRTLTPKMNNPRLGMDARRALQEELDTLRTEWNALKRTNPDIIELAKRVEGRGAFKAEDYYRSTDENLTGDAAKALKQMMDQTAQAGGVIKPLEDSIIQMRMAVDNMSGRLGIGGISDDAFEAVKSNLGKYMTKVYRHHEQKGLFGLGKYKPVAEEISAARSSFVDSRLIATRRKILSDKLKAANASARAAATPGTPAAVIKKGDPMWQQFEKEAIDEVDKLTKNDKFMTGIEAQADDAIAKYLSKIEGDQIPVPGSVKQSRFGDVDVKEVDEIRIDNSVLKERVLEPWQRHLLGEVKDPSYTFFQTVGKQAHLNSTLRIMDDIAKMGTQGNNPFVKTADEVMDAIDPHTGEVDIRKWKKVEGLEGIATPLDNLYIKAPYYDAIFDTKSNWLNRQGNTVGLFYKYAVLAPKATSQIAKTILSPLTHVRNALSAGAFVAANGAFFPTYGDIQMLLPKALGGQAIYKQAWSLSGKRVLGTMTKADEALYQRLLKVGVVDSQVQAGEIKQLLDDILKDPAKIDRQIGSKIPSKVDAARRKALKGFAKLQDSYVAEDDFWKVINWSLERNRYDQLAKHMGLSSKNFKNYLNPATAEGKSGAGKYFQNMTKRKGYINSAITPDEGFSNFLDEVAGNLTRNNVPNYAYIGRTGRALRQTPFGNFIAFPIEIMRTGNNIYTTAIDEITTGIGKGTWSNPEFKELYQMGLKRLFSFGTTVAGVPAGLVATAKAYHDVDDEEMDALRKMVPEWSKNSTLIPMGRDENGYLKYIDFSYSNAYDTLIRPFNSIVNALGENEGRDSLMKALGTGMEDGLSELLKPYATESIYTEALLDSVIRRGVGRGGRKIWNDEDDWGVKVGKSMLHLGKALEPGSFRQLIRLSKAAAGTTDKYGRHHKLEDEIHSLYGMRIINSDPENSMKYMISDFTKRLTNDRNLFQSPLIKGGRITPNDILNRYKYSEAKRFATMKDMYQDIEAARTLGMSDAKIRRMLYARKGLDRDVAKDVLRGVYEPKQPSTFFIKRMREITKDLNEKEGVDIENPYNLIRPFIREIISTNRNISLKDDYIKIPNFDEEIPDPTGALGLKVQDMMPAGLTATYSPDANIVQATNQGTGTPIPYNQMTIAQRLEYDKLMRGIG
jgi:hypothetical protein